MLALSKYQLGRLKWRTECISDCNSKNAFEDGFYNHLFKLQKNLLSNNSVVMRMTLDNFSSFTSDLFLQQAVNSNKINRITFDWIVSENSKQWQRIFLNVLNLNLGEAGATQSVLNVYIKRRTLHRNVLLSQILGDASFLIFIS